MAKKPSSLKNSYFVVVIFTSCSVIGRNIDKKYFSMTFELFVSKGNVKLCLLINVFLWNNKENGVLTR